MLHSPVDTGFAHHGPVLVDYVLLGVDFAPRFGRAAQQVGDSAFCFTQLECEPVALDRSGVVHVDHLRQMVSLPGHLGAQQ